MRPAATIQHSKVKIALRASVCKIKIFVLSVLSALFVFKKYSVRSVCPQNIRVIPKAPLDFFSGFFDMIVAGRRDYDLMTEALLVKPVKKTKKSNS